MHKCKTNHSIKILIYNNYEEVFEQLFLSVIQIKMYLLSICLILNVIIISNTYIHIKFKLSFIRCVSFNRIDIYNYLKLNFLYTFSS